MQKVSELSHKFRNFFYEIINLKSEIILTRENFRMKKFSQNTWIKIALSILGVLAAILVYVPNYAAVDQGLKGRCAIIAVVLLWLPMELKSSIFALNFYYELGLILIIVFLMTNQMAMNFTIGLVLALLLLTWIGM